MESNTPVIVKIISRYTALLHQGDIYIGFCPFCSDKDEKLIVRPELNEWHCFNCGLGGSAIDFITEHEGVSKEKAIGLANDMLKDDEELDKELSGEVHVLNIK